MMWLTWRQFRAQTITTVGILAVCAVVLGVTGAHLSRLFTASGMSACHVRVACAQLGGGFIGQIDSRGYGPLFYGGILVLLAAPALMGIFWGAPLVARELESGTLRLVWNQSVTRSRWLAAKLGLVGLAAISTAGLLSLMINWWASPIYQAAKAAGSNALFENRYQPELFIAGIVPIGYAAFAFALGVTAGVLIRRTVPAMAVTLAGFALVQVAWPIWVRPHLLTPRRSLVPINPATASLGFYGHNTMTVTGPVNKPGAWIISNQTINSAGHVFTGPATHACLTGSGGRGCHASILALHLRQLVVFQPASRFWTFQWYETAIFVALAVALGGFSAWWISRRRLA